MSPLWPWIFLSSWTLRCVSCNVTCPEFSNEYTNFNSKSRENLKLPVVNIGRKLNRPDCSLLFTAKWHFVFWSAYFDVSDAYAASVFYPEDSTTSSFLGPHMLYTTLFPNTINLYRLCVPYRALRWNCFLVQNNKCTISKMFNYTVLFTTQTCFDLSCDHLYGVE